MKISQKKTTKLKKLKKSEKSSFNYDVRVNFFVRRFRLKLQLWAWFVLHSPQWRHKHHYYKQEVAAPTTMPATKTNRHLTINHIMTSHRINNILNIDIALNLGGNCDVTENNCESQMPGVYTSVTWPLNSSLWRHNTTRSTADYY